MVRHVVGKTINLILRLQFLTNKPAPQQQKVVVKKNIYLIEYVFWKAESKKKEREETDFVDFREIYQVMASQKSGRSWLRGTC